MESRFYIADDIQSLQGGKLAMMGVYADTVLFVQPNDVPVKRKARPAVPSLPRLCMLMNITGVPAGKHAVEPKITFPSGKPAPAIHSMEVDLPRGGTTNALMRFEPFPIPEFGVYKLSIGLANETLEHTFEIRRGASVQQPTSAPSRKLKTTAKKVPASSARKRTAN
jgi:hypothetical protein